MFSSKTVLMIFICFQTEICPLAEREYCYKCLLYRNEKTNSGRRIRIALIQCELVLSYILVMSYLDINLPEVMAVHANGQSTVADLVVLKLIKRLPRPDPHLYWLKT